MTVLLQTEPEPGFDWQRFTLTQLRAVVQSWQQDRKALVMEVARQAHQEELAHHTDRQHQQDIFSQLRERVEVYEAH
jgi:hypothetical protein